jgi:hypothetical protein
MDAYYSIWRILKINKRYKSLIDFSFYLVKISHNSEVLFEDWLKSYILYSKALYLDDKLNDALELLRGLLDIFANIPLDEIKYLSEINKKNKISLKNNNFFDFDYVLSFYSKYHIYSKCEAIFTKRIKHLDNKINWDIESIGIGIDNDGYLDININKNENINTKRKIKQNYIDKISKTLIEDDDIVNFNSDIYTNKFEEDENNYSEISSSLKISSNSFNNIYYKYNNDENLNENKGKEKFKFILKYNYF